MTTPDLTHPRCRLTIDRASVLAGADGTSHQEVWQLPGSTAVAESLSIPMYFVVITPSVRGPHVEPAAPGRPGATGLDGTAP